jgi:hypothetical protein
MAYFYGSILTFAWEERGKTMKNLGQDSWSVSRDLNLGHPE